MNLNEPPADLLVDAEGRCDSRSEATQVRATAADEGARDRTPHDPSPDPQGGAPGDGREEAADAWQRWLETPAARYVLAWEQAEFDHAVSDVFGYYALQCGLPRLRVLRENRMSLRLRACAWDQDDCASPARPTEAGRAATQAEAGIASEPDRSIPEVWIDRYDALPFADQSLDLVGLPHVLEFADDPHRVLREVERVLRPEGRVMVSGFNPASLWGARQLVGRAVSSPFLPAELQFIGLPRLRDWFKLLGMEMDRGRFGCYRPAVKSERWLERTRFMEPAGDRWWPICGAVYFVSAIKRVPGMRLVGPRMRRRLPRAPAIAVAPHRVGEPLAECVPADSAAPSAMQGQPV